MKEGMSAQDLIEHLSGQLDELVEQGGEMLVDAAEKNELEDPSYATLISSSADNNSWMIGTHIRFSNFLHGIDSLSYVELGDDRGGFEITLPDSNDINFDYIPQKLARAHDELYLRVATVLTLLIESKNHLSKPGQTAKEQAISTGIRDAWLECARAIPNVLDDDYTPALERFTAAIDAWMKLSGYSKKELLQLRNQNLPTFWLDQYGKTPEISMTWAGEAEELTEDPKATCVPVRDVIIHNQEKKKTEFRSARQIRFKHGDQYLSYYFVAPRMKFSKSKVPHFKRSGLEETHIEQQREYYENFCKEAGIKEKRVYLFDLRSDEWIRDKEAVALKIMKATAKTREFQKRFTHISLPLVELESGYGFPLKNEHAQDMWSYPLWALLKEDVWPHLEANDQKDGVKLLEAWKQCSLVGKGLTTVVDKDNNDESKEHFYKHYKLLAETMYSGESKCVRWLAATALFSLDYHFHNLRLELSDDRTLEAIKRRIASEQVLVPELVDAEKRAPQRMNWRAGGFWSLAIGLVTVIGGLIGGFAVDTPIIALIVALVSLAVFGSISAVCFSEAKRFPKPKVPLSRSPSPWAQFYAALTGSRMSGAMLASSLMGLLEDFSPDSAFINFCMSTKDRTSIFQQAHAYQLACDDLLVASRDVKPEIQISKASRSRTPRDLEERVARSGKLIEHEKRAKAFVFRTTVLFKQNLMVYMGVFGAMSPALLKLLKYPVPKANPSFAEDTLESGVRSAYQHHKATLFGRFADAYEKQRNALVSKGARERNQLYPDN